MDEKKLRRAELELQKIADDDSISTEDFATAFDVVVALFRDSQEWTEEQVDSFRSEFDELKKLNDKQWDKIKTKFATFRNGKDGADGRDGVDGKDGKDGINGKDGEKGRDGKDGKDGSPDTGDEIVEKINKGEKKISGDRIDGLADIKRMAQANAVGGGIGVTKTELATKITGIGTHKITVSDTAPANPSAYDIWVDIG